MKIALALALSLAASSAPAAELVGRPSVVDGDTLDIAGTRVRMFGIDAPESAQTCLNAQGKTWRCGQRAALALADRIGQGKVRCAERDRDRYGRIVAVCVLNQTGEDLNGWMVEQGHALAYTTYATDYVDEEGAAKEVKRGVWAGTFVAPWDWRKGVREVAGPIGPVPAGRCEIKGNISSNGRIYHVPGSRFYERTQIDESKGERWFCTDGEARQAGWRPAGRSGESLWPPSSSSRCSPAR